MCPSNEETITKQAEITTNNILNGNAPFSRPPQTQFYLGEALEVLSTLPSASVHSMVTSPPYFGLRDYDKEEQLGREKTPGAFVHRLTAIMREARRVLRPDGTLWMNLGDTYANKQLLCVPFRAAMALQDDGWYLRTEIIRTLACTCGFP